MDRLQRLKGVIIDNMEEVTMCKMPITEFAKIVDVNRNTLPDSSYTPPKNTLNC